MPNNQSILALSAAAAVAISVGVIAYINRRQQKKRMEKFMRDTTEHYKKSKQKLTDIYGEEVAEKVFG